MSHRQILVVFSGLMLGMLLAALDQSIVSDSTADHRWRLPLPQPPDLGRHRLSPHLDGQRPRSTERSRTSTAASSIFQFAIVIFLAASALAGLSQNMDQLIVFRGVQGLGAGGLIVLAMAIVGDVVAPAERGRYQGYFGAVFGIAEHRGTACRRLSRSIRPLGAGSST